MKPAVLGWSIGLGIVIVAILAWGVDALRSQRAETERFNARTELIAARQDSSDRVDAASDAPE